VEKLFGLFGKARKYKKRRDPEKQRERLNDKYIANSIASNSELERQWLAEKYGIHVDPEDDPISKMVVKLRAKWTTEALGILGEDKMTQESAIRSLLEEIKKSNDISQKSDQTGKKGFQTTDVDGQGNPNAAKRNLRKEIIEKSGDVARNDGPAAAFNINLLSLMLSELANSLAAAGTHNSGSRTIAVEVEGKLVEMSPEAYQIFKKQREELMAARARSKDLPPSSPQF